MTDELAPEAELSKDPLHRLVDALGYRFEDRTLLVRALTHRSFVNEVDDPAVRDNERLEFLGDAVLDLVVSEELMARFPAAREGQLSKMRAGVVSERGLARIARRIHLGPALRLDLPKDDTLQHHDPKTELQHRVQATRHITPTYRLVKEEGPEHEKRFIVEIMIAGQAIARGEGRTKKEAEQRAAATALEGLGPPDAEA